jgi:uncharacterized protein YqjF (DUF2071 family)
MHPSLTQLEHRPWPLPTQKWAWRQSWNELLFVHYRCDANSLRSLVPPELKIQEFDGSSWIGVVPFEMNRVMRRPLPDLPTFKHFLELNVRIYVEHNGVPGVWFLSLDATHPVVVWGGQKFFGLPYKNALIEAMPTPIGVGHYRARRRREEAEFEVQFRTFGADFFAKAGTLEHFLTERYCFYSLTQKGLLRSDVHHAPWALKNVSGHVLQNTLLNHIPAVHEQVAEQREPLFHFSHGVDVICWNPILVKPTTSG